MEEAVCVSLCTNALRKSMNSFVFSPTMGKQLDKLGSLALIRQPV